MLAVYPLYEKKTMIDKTNEFFDKNPKLKKAGQATAIGITVGPVPGGVVAGPALYYAVDRKGAKKFKRKVEKYGKEFFKGKKDKK